MNNDVFREVVTSFNFRYVGQKELITLASFFQEKPEVVMVAYLKRLQAGALLPLLRLN